MPKVMLSLLSVALCACSIRGQEWTVLNRYNSSLTARSVTSLATGPDGRLYIGTEHSGLFTLDFSDTTIRKSSVQAFRYRRVQHLAFDSAGQLLAGTSNGLLQLLEGDNTPLRIGSGNISGMIRVDSRVYYAARRECGCPGLRRYDLQTEETETLEEDGGPAPCNVSIIAPGKGDSILVGVRDLHCTGTSGKSYDIDGRLYSYPGWNTFRPAGKRHPAWWGKTPSAAARLGEQLWVATESGHLYRSGGELADIGMELLTHGYVTAISRDSSGTTWLGSTSGLIAFPDAATMKVYLESSSSLPHDSVHAVLVTPANIVAVGTSEGLVLIPGAGTTPVAISAPLPRHTAPPRRTVGLRVIVRQEASLSGMVYSLRGRRLLPEKMKRPGVFVVSP
jgi:ligand-binding sensor domain-containing protein